MVAEAYHRYFCALFLYELAQAQNSNKTRFGFWG